MEETIPKKVSRYMSDPVLREKTMLKSAATYKSLTPEQRRSQTRKHLYGLTDDLFNSILSDQSFRCAVCETADPGVGKSGAKKWCVDHDHKTGRIRGILCTKCNIALGLANDDEWRLFALAEYLIESRKKKLPGRSRY